jgi:hypothetical protein
MMAEIASPLSSAMKTRAKAAIDAIDEESHNYTSRTPRLLRALILSQDDSDPVRAAMASEGWFVAMSSNTFSSASTTAVDVS